MSTFDQSLPMMLYRVLDDIMPAYRKLFARFGLTEQQWRVLRVVWTSDTVTSANLAERTLLSAPSLVGMIDRLESKGLVERVRSRSDRRETFIVATQKGAALQREVMPFVEEVQRGHAARLTKSQWVQLNALLEGLCQKADETVEV